MGLTRNPIVQMVWDRLNDEKRFLGNLLNYADAAFLSSLVGLFPPPATCPLSTSSTPTSGVYPQAGQSTMMQSAYRVSEAVVVNRLTNVFVGQEERVVS